MNITVSVREDPKWKEMARQVFVGREVLAMEKGVTLRRTWDGLFEAKDSTSGAMAVDDDPAKALMQVRVLIEQKEVQA
jgi:hypothetical protein